MSVEPSTAAVVFGGFGAIGAAVSASLEQDGHRVIRAGRAHPAELDGESLVLDPIRSPPTLAELDRLPPLAVVVWAQGTNTTDSITHFDVDVCRDVFETNCLYVAVTLARLLDAGRVQARARLCVVSSIWQEAARQEKLSYTISKAALGGLVRSVAVDLGDRGILINAVLPGALDTPMTRSMLSDDQIARLMGQTTSGRLATPTDVATLVSYLCSTRNTGVTGQSIAVDMGYSGGRLV